MELEETPWDVGGSLVFCAIDCTRGCKKEVIQNNQETVPCEIEGITPNSFIVGCLLAFVR
jgi:hypothetical protein